MRDQDEGPAADIPRAPARLRAIVAIEFERRVRCQQPGCGHSVHAAVHVVEEAGQLLVLGSTCFAKRYGSAGALGSAQYGGGTGRKLTDEERVMLAENSRALLAHFEAEETAAAALAKAQAATAEKQRQEVLAERARALEAAHQQQSDGRRSPSPPGRTPVPSSPWPWQLSETSVALFESPDGAKWVRVQHKDRSQKLVPWPRFPGWNRALPPGAGEPDYALGAVSVANIVEAIKLLQRFGFRGPMVGRWQDILK